jgi:hypothetical protein
MHSGAQPVASLFSISHACNCAVCRYQTRTSYPHNWSRLSFSAFLVLSLSRSAGNTARLDLDDKCSARAVARNPLHRLTCDVQWSLYLKTMLCSGHPTACAVTHSGRLTALAHSLQCRGMPCCCIASHIVDSAIDELLHCLCSQVACRISMAAATNSRLLEASQNNAKQSNAKQNKAKQCKQCKQGKAMQTTAKQAKQCTQSKAQHCKAMQTKAKQAMQTLS